MSKPRVLIICPFFSPNLGGVERHLDILTEYLVKNSYSVSVLTYRPLVTKIDNYMSYERKGKLEIHRFWWFPGFFDKTTPYPALQFFYIIPGLLICSLFWMIKNHQRVEVIHAHGFAAAFITRVIGLFWQDKRTVFSTHFIYKRLNPGGLYGRLFKWVAGGFNQILLIGEESGKELRLAGLDGKKMKIFHHWLDPNVFRPKNKTGCQRRLNLPKARMVVLYIGRILRMKGVFNLLEVAKVLPKDILMIFVGDGQDFEEFNNQARNLSNIIIAGRRVHEEIIDFLGASDFLILPSIAEEAQPMVVMEALMSGRPVITTNKGAVGEMFTKDVGLTLDPTVENLKKAILYFYRHRQKLIVMQKKARVYALKKFGPINAKIITSTYL